MASLDNLSKGKAMDIHNYPWISLAIQGQLWRDMDIQKYPWISRYPWLTLGISASL